MRVPREWYSYRFHPRRDQSVALMGESRRRRVARLCRGGQRRRAARVRRSPRGRSRSGRSRVGLVACVLRRLCRARPRASSWGCRPARSVRTSSQRSAPSTLRPPPRAPATAGSRRPAARRAARVRALQRPGGDHEVVGVNVEPVDRQVCARGRSHEHILPALWRKNKWGHAYLSDRSRQAGREATEVQLLRASVAPKG